MSEEIPVFSWNTKTKEFNVLGHKFDGVNSVEEFIEYLQNQDKEIERLNKEIIGLNNCIIEFHREFCNKQAEINRLNNIINELEKYINEEYIYDELGMKIFDASKLQDKLQELKGEDK